VREGRGGGGGERQRRARRQAGHRWGEWQIVIAARAAVQVGEMWRRVVVCVRGSIERKVSRRKRAANPRVQRRTQ